MRMEKKTPLYDVHVAAGGKMVPFAGYLMPIQYGTGIIAEHNAVRNQAGMFDVSHMAELELSGPDALANVNNLVTNDCAVLEAVSYTHLDVYKRQVLRELRPRPERSKRNEDCP